MRESEIAYENHYYAKDGACYGTELLGHNVAFRRKLSTIGTKPDISKATHTLHEAPPSHSTQTVHSANASSVLTARMLGMMKTADSLCERSAMLCRFCR